MKLTRLFIFLALIIVGIEVINIGLNHLIGNSLFVYRLILLVLSFIFYKLFEPKIHRWIVPQKENQRLNINEIDDYSGYNDTQKLTIVTREMKKQIYDLHSLFEVSVNLTSILDYDRLIKSYLLSVIGQSKTSGVVILFPSNDNWQILKPAFSKGFSNKKLTKLEIPYNDPLIQNFKNKAIPVNLSDYIKKKQSRTLVSIL